MAFETFDLGRVLQTAEAIKAQRRQPAEDELRNKVLNAQLAATEQGTMLQKQAADQQMEATTAHRAYYTTRAILSAADPKAAAESLAPDFIKHFDETHGAGSWKGLTPEQAVQAAKAIQTQALGVIGPQQKVKWIDSGGQQVAVDDETGVPIKEVAPIAKTATPDATLSAQTSTANAELSANTTVRGQDIGASTTRRGQDIGAQTAAAGQAVTTRGQDLTAETAAKAALGGGKMTEVQGNAKAFGLRATEANKSLEMLMSPADKGGGGYNPTGSGGTFDAMAVGHLTTNWLASEKGQQYQTIAKAFMAPILRKESGAAINESEWAMAKSMYIPWTGDKPAQLAQKAENRRIAIESLAIQAGPGGIPAPEGGKSINFVDLPD